MINANIVFAIFILVFGMVGAMRGWVREVVVTASLVLALFVLSQLGDQWNKLVAGLTKPGSPEQWLLRSFPMFFIAFFGYLGPAVVRSKFEQNARGKVEQGLLAFIIGMVNGFIIFSTLALIAWKCGLLQNPPAPGAGQSPLFSEPVGGWGELFFIKNAAMSILSGTTLVIVLIAIFLFVIVVII
jgi:hypothetical protein